MTWRPRAAGWRGVLGLGATVCAGGWAAFGACTTLAHGQPTTQSTQLDAPAADAPPTAFDLRPEKYTLGNGLEVLLLEDHTLPRVAVNVWYHVGPANEPRGRSGFAHLFEHLMFEGSQHQRAGFDALMESLGATNVNGTTDFDRTNYFETVPAEHLEVVLWMESDRMGFLPAVLTQQRLDVQRDVVKNERRQSFENSPYGPSTLAMYDALFPPGHPYHGAVIGSMADLDRATLDDVRAFYELFYVPSNATLALVGDFDSATARGWLERYFGSLPAKPRPPRVQHATPPLAKGSRHVVREPVQLARVTLAWIAPPAYSADDAALDVATTLLADGKATPLYQRLVVEAQVATEVEAYLEANALASVVSVSALVRDGVDPDAVLREIDAVLTRLSERGPSPQQVKRALRRIELSVASSLQLLNGSSGESGRAGIIQRLNHYLGDPAALPKQVAALRRVTPDDVQGVLSRHLRPEARVVVVTKPLRQEAATP